MVDKHKLDDYGRIFVNAAYAYYELNDPVMTDAQFDAMARDFVKEYKSCPVWFTELFTLDDLKAGSAFHLRGKWPAWVSTSGKPRIPFAPVKHLTPMFSLENGFTSDDVSDFLYRLYPNKEPDLYLDVKADGMAGNLIYRGGKLVSGASRGDGETGDDITHLLGVVVGVPQEFKVIDGCPEVVEIRGEFVMRIDDFEEFNRKAEEAGTKTLVNPRAGVSGSLRLTDLEEVAKRRIHFYAYGASYDHELVSQEALMDQIREWGFSRVPRLPDAMVKSGKLLDYITAPDARQKIAELVPFPIDGVVLKFNEMAAQKLLGARSRTPRWAMAYKFPPECATTTIKEIVLQIGRTGVVTPVAEVETVFVGGVNVTRATLHNEANVENWDFRAGDTVLIRRAGDVIPEIYNNMDMLSPHRATKKRWSMPRHCPSCGSELEREDGKKKIYCKNSYACPAQLLAMCTHMVSRDAYDIEGLAEGTLAKLIEADVIHFPYQVLLLDEDWIAQVTGRVVAAKVMAAMDRSCAALPLHKFIYALGIPLVGQTTARDLANTYGSLDEVVRASVESLVTIDGIEETTARRIAEAFADGGVHGEIEQRRARTKIVNPTKVAHQPMRGQTVVITGSFDDMDRSDVTEFFLSMGAKVSSSVSHKTTMVIAGDNAGSKLAKAEKLKITVLDKDQLNKLIHKEKEAT